MEIAIYWEGRGLAFPVSDFWSVIPMSEHSRVTVDVPNAPSDQTGQDIHNIVSLRPSPPLESFIGGQRMQPTLEKFSQNERG